MNSKPKPDLRQKLLAPAKRRYSGAFIEELQDNFRDIARVAAEITSNREAAARKLIANPELYANEIRVLRGIVDAPQTVAEQLSRYGKHALLELRQ